MLNGKPLIGISVGDLNGIGLEVIMKAFEPAEMLDFCTPVIFASSKVVSYHRKALGMDKFNFQVIHAMDKVLANKINLFNCWKEEVVLELGQENKEVGKYAFKSLDAACENLENNVIDALVTAPIHKAAIQSDDFKFAGHTDYLESRFKGKATMMLISEEMRMALATVHIPLANVASALSTELILKKIKDIGHTLKKDFHIPKGRIAVLALNPHAGDHGLIGDEDDRIVAPAIQQALDNGVMAFGPYPADSFFGSGNHKNFDAILAMYHDQGLIPFKSMSFGQGVNYSSGLTITRTSPDHGTGFDIAGKGIANESSFREAVLLACDLVQRRAITQEIERRPLKINRGKKDD
ncbi:MAG: 4-hydroxythreonine-4-phosphate dehydrogenase PdxA [Owenweeksia sp.]